MFIAAQKNLRYTKFYDSNVIDRLEQQLKKFSYSYWILIVGDFNSRTGTEPGYITEDTRDLSFLPGDYELDTFTVPRNNEDVSIMFFGQQLPKFSIEARLRILNGRTRGDCKSISLTLVFKGAAQ